MIISNFSLYKQKKKPNEILSLLLKKCLGERLDKLEQKNIKEEIVLSSIKVESNKMTKMLEDSSKKSKNYLI